MATEVTIRLVLETIERVRGTELRLKDELVRVTGQSVRVIHEVMVRADRQGLIDGLDGTSIWDSYLTDEGKARLEQLRLGDGP